MSKKIRAMTIAGVVLIFLATVSLLTVSKFSMTTVIQLDHGPSQPDSTIAIDPENASLMFQSETVGGSGLGLYSLDGGKTWHQPTVAPGLGINDDPSVGIDQDGTYYDIEHTRAVINASFSNAYAVNYLEYSGDHGKTWSLDPVPYASMVTNNTLNAVQTTWTFLNGTVTRSCDLPGYDAVGDYEKIAVDNNPLSRFAGNIYIIGNFAVAADNSCSIQAGFIRSSDKGQTWDLHIVTNPVLTDSQVEKLSIGPNGEVYFVRNNSLSGLKSILFEKSTDAGASWSYSTLSNSAQVNGNILANPSMAVSNAGQLSIVYEACLTTCNMTQNGQSAVYLIDSDNDGASWSPYTKISDSNSVPLWSYIPIPPSSCNAIVECAPPRAEINVIYTSVGLASVWRDWRNSSNSSMTDLYGYIPSLKGSNVRITPQTSFICYPPNKTGPNYCNDFGQAGGSFISMASTDGRIYIAYGLDANGDRYPDSVLVTITIPASGTSHGFFQGYETIIAAIGGVLVAFGTIYLIRNRLSSTNGKHLSPRAVSNETRELFGTFVAGPAGIEPVWRFSDSRVSLCELKARCSTSSGPFAGSG